MCKKLIYLTCFVLVLGFAVNSTFGELVAYYPMNEGSGTVIKDVSGYGRDGVAAAEPNWVDGPPGFGKALYFDGVNPARAWVNCGTWNPSEGTGQLTVALWLKWNGLNGAWQGVVAKRDGWDAATQGPLMWYMEMNMDTGDIFFTRMGIGAGIAAGAVAPPIGEWQHVAVSYDGGTTATCYVNGQDANSGDFSFGPGVDSTVMIGADNLGGANGFNGTIDEVRLYNTALTKEEIQAVMLEVGFVAAKALNPHPVDKEIEVPRDVALRWRPGIYAATHNVYFGKDFNNVNEASVTDTRGVLVSPNQDANSYDPPGLLDWNQTYFWRIDEVNDLDPNSPWKGNVWSFTVTNFTLVDNFEDYDDVNNIIYYTWEDYYANNTGMTVGYFTPPIAEQSIVHKGKQAMYMHYDNDGTINEGTDYERTGTLTFSEAQRTWADAQDWTKDGAASLTIWFRGLIGAIGSFTLGPPIKINGVGTDIAGTADQLHFAYKILSGDGTITAKVISITNTDSLAKAGVMMRESLDAGSKHFSTVACPSSRVYFVRRTTTPGNTSSTSKTGVAIPVWVRLTRSGNTFTSQYSTNGTTWTTLGTPQEFQMLLDVYVGLCVSSRNANTACTAEFSDVTNPGTGNWKSQDIGLKVNSPQQLYVALQDSASNSAVVKYSDPAATNITTWTQWSIPLSAFTGVNSQSITKLTIGVGDRASTQPSGAGDLYIDDIRLYQP